MSRRSLLSKYQLLNAEDSASTLESISTDISGVDLITYQISCDSAVDSLLSVMCCNDVILSPSSIFVALNFSAILSINGAIDTEYFVTVQNQGFRHIKLSFANNGGTGNISAWVSGTSVGA